MLGIERGCLNANLANISALNVIITGSSSSSQMMPATWAIKRETYVGLVDATAKKKSANQKTTDNTPVRVCALSSAKRHKNKTTKFWAYSNMTSESDHQQPWMSQHSKAKAISMVITSSAMAPRNDRWPPHTWGLKAWNEMKSILYFEQCLHGHVVKNAVNTTMTTRWGCLVLSVCLVAFTASIGGLSFARKTFTPAQTWDPC